MKRALTALSVALIATLPGCNRLGPSGPPPDAASSTVAQNTDAVRRIHEERGRYLIQTEQDLKEWQERANQLRQQRDRAPINSPDYLALNTKVQDLEKRLAQAREQFKTLNNAASQAWQENKPNLDTTLTGIEQLVQSTKAE